MAPSSIVFGNLLATILEAALFGLYTVLFVTVLYLFQSRERRPHQVVLIGLVVQFLALLGHWINTFYQALHAIGHLDSDAATAYYNSPSLSFRLDMVLFGVVTFATNVVMIHRVYVVFLRRIAPVVLPLAHLLGQLVAASGIVYSLLKSQPGEEFSDLAVFWSPWVIAYLGISIVISVHTSCMIIRKLLRLRKAFPAEVLLSGSGRTSFVVRVFLFGCESHLCGIQSICANLAECAALQTYVPSPYL
ncbi:hypothetical protein HMN09_00799100 [Mycena chlorophos]|uniref:Uncharacterized protein n=1 Tax=Mycena chlorophos TaxID=658473 RepID=A0A8H6SU77_MYCCL|nr:hypothetical protein HMN09_00799100 [Mycena chlorophos]